MLKPVRKCLAAVGDAKRLWHCDRYYPAVPEVIYRQ